VKIVPILVGAVSAENEAMYGQILAKYVDHSYNFFAISQTFVTENEAALIAARGEGTQVTMEHFEAAIDRIIGGLEKRNKVCLLKFYITSRGIKYILLFP